MKDMKWSSIYIRHFHCVGVFVSPFSELPILIFLNRELWCDNFRTFVCPFLLYREPREGDQPNFHSFCSGVLWLDRLSLHTLSTKVVPRCYRVSFSDFVITSRIEENVFNRSTAVGSRTTVSRPERILCRTTMHRRRRSHSLRLPLTLASIPLP